MIPEPKVGDEVWWFDPNTRKWDENKRIIWAYHWVRRYVVKVTARFVYFDLTPTGTGKGGWGFRRERADFPWRDIALSQLELDGLVYRNDNEDRLAEAMRTLPAYAMAEVAAIVREWEPVPPLIR